MYRVQYPVADLAEYTYTDADAKDLHAGGPSIKAVSAVAGYVILGTFFRLQSSYCDLINICMQYVHRAPINIVPTIPTA